VAVSLVVVVVVARLAVLGVLVEVTIEDNFLTLEVVGFMKLRLALAVVLRALLGLDGVNVALEVILMGLDLAVIFGVDVVGLIEPLFLVKSCWLRAKKCFPDLQFLKKAIDLPVRC